jgi:hypothetical protein
MLAGALCQDLPIDQRDAEDAGSQAAELRTNFSRPTVFPPRPQGMENPLVVRVLSLVRRPQHDGIQRGLLDLWSRPSLAIRLVRKTLTD